MQKNLTSKKLNICCNNGFTLAEVLITLAVIGIVAAMSIPSLMGSTNDKEIVVGVKKAYAVLSQATLMINSECGGSVLNCLSNSGAPANNTATMREIADLYKSKLSVAKDCDTGTGCFPDDVTYRELDGDDYLKIDDAMSVHKLVLNDGTLIAIGWSGATWPEGSISFRVDVNGIKGASQNGRDLFWFAYNMTTKNFEPLGVNGYVGDCVDVATDEGRGCTQRVLSEDAIAY